jgi:hypothetical protein
MYRYKGISAAPTSTRHSSADSSIYTCVPFSAGTHHMPASSSSSISYHHRRLGSSAFPAGQEHPGHSGRTVSTAVPSAYGGQEENLHWTGVHAPRHAQLRAPIAAPVRSSQPKLDDAGRGHSGPEASAPAALVRDAEACHFRPVGYDCKSMVRCTRGNSRNGLTGARDRSKNST